MKTFKNIYEYEKYFFPAMVEKKRRESLTEKERISEDVDKMFDELEIENRSDKAMKSNKKD